MSSDDQAQEVKASLQVGVLCWSCLHENAALVICSLYWNYVSIIDDDLDLNLADGEGTIAVVGYWQCLGELRE